MQSGDEVAHCLDVLILLVSQIHAIHEPKGNVHDVRQRFHQLLAAAIFIVVVTSWSVQQFASSNSIVQHSVILGLIILFKKLSQQAWIVVDLAVVEAEFAIGDAFGLGVGEHYIEIGSAAAHGNRVADEGHSEFAQGWLGDVEFIELAGEVWTEMQIPRGLHFALLVAHVTQLDVDLGYL